MDSIDNLDQITDQGTGMDDQSGADDIHEETQSDLERYAREKLGYKPDGKYSLEQFLDHKLALKNSPDQSKSMIRNLTRIIDRKFSQFKEDLDRRSQYQIKTEIKAIEEELDEAISNQDKEKVIELSSRLGELRGHGNGSMTRKETKRPDVQSRQYADDEDVQDKLEEFIENNSWCTANEEISDFVKEELTILTKQGYGADEALRRIRRASKREFPELFSGDSETNGNGTGQRYKPPIGGGRPEGYGGRVSISDLPREFQDSAREYIKEFYVKGGSVSQQDLLQQYINYTPGLRK